MTHNPSRRHHSSKGNRRCVDDELLTLVLQMILPNTQLPLTYLAMVKEGFEWKATWERLEIKVQMIGMESLDLNTLLGKTLYTES